MNSKEKPRNCARFSFGITIIFSVIFAMLTQGIAFVDIMYFAANGGFFTSDYFVSTSAADALAIQRSLHQK